MSAARNYVPQQGTLSAKVIDYLKAQPVGAQVPTQVLLDAIGQPDMKNIRSYMLPAIGAGLVHCERVSGERSLQWSLGSGEQPSEHGQAQGVDEYADLAGLPPTPDLTKSSVFAMAQSRLNDSAPATAASEDSSEVAYPPGGHQAWPFKSEPAANPQPAVAAEVSPGEFRCALFSDGQLLIKTGRQEATLPVEHTRQLLHYLDRISFDGHSAGVVPK